MPKFMFRANYTAAGDAGLRREGGSARRAAVERAVKGVGGTLEGFYFAFGDIDAYCICDLPDNATAAALALAVDASGAATTSTVVLLTPEEVDAAMKKEIGYRPPGG